jgi:Plasmid stabilization system protein
MNYDLIVSKYAHEDIDDIAEYILHELKNPQATVKFLNDIETSYSRVSENPKMYSLCNDGRLAQKKYRKIVINNYLIFYRIDEKKKTVYIVRVVYGGRNYPEML